ncbi:hypothetical protein BJY01DRAFT_247336 [Aspergillus pseudoustus]|uniref:Uncharacterized protein n=1 Tax=Aspergillus pseudoustus TaxID=1810923 RepID=A0ABR4K1F4_9EURO
MAMEAAAGVPIAVGIQALKILNGWLESKELAGAWYGPEADDFTSTKLSVKKIRRIITGRRLNVEKAFAVHRQQWPELIRNCLEKSHTWYSKRYDGECCWLPLYRSLRHNNTNNNRDSADVESILKPANSNPSFIATMSSLPAAHLDTWGLVVLAYASGARLRFHEFNGGYYAAFDTKNFVLVIKRENMVSPTMAHLTPTEPKSNMSDQLSEHEWKKLLDTGCSVDQGDELFRWFKDVTCPNDPVEAPDELVDGRMDRKIKRLIIDDSHASALKQNLVGTIYGCHYEWQRWQKQRGKSSVPLKEQAIKISENLLKAKVLSGDEIRTPYCEEMARNDVLRYAENQLKLVKDAIRDYPNPGHGLEDVLSLHRNVVAYQKLLSLSLRIPTQLSTRDTGDSLILAGQ